MAWTVTTDAASEPVTVTEVRDQLRLSGITAFDDEITIMIKAARQYVEKSTNTALLTQTITEVFAEFPANTEKTPYYELKLAVSPVQSVTSVAYKDTGGVSTTIASANYDVDTISTKARVAPIPTYSWPSDVYQGINAITTTYVAGHTDTTALPAPYKKAILLIITKWFEMPNNPIEEKQTAADKVLRRYRVFEF